MALTPAQEQAVMDKFHDRLERAFVRADHGNPYWSAVVTLAILRSSAKALFPGKQTLEHVLPSLKVMVKAAVRSIGTAK